MSIKYLNSNQLNVFPVTNKPSEPQSRLTTEYNITNLINRLVDKKSFVITSNNALSTDPLEFTLDGYYVKVDIMSEFLNALDLDDFTASNNTEINKIFAAICINEREAEDVPNAPKFQELMGTDYSIENKESNDELKDKYTGVMFFHVSTNISYQIGTGEENSTTLNIKSENCSIIPQFNGVITKMESGQPTVVMNNESYDGSKFIYLCILEYVNNEWQIPRASKIRFNQWALEGLDDGDLDNPNNTLYN